jgi:TolA-binding protein
MSEDRLLEAARALRESTEVDGPGAAFTRARIMASLHQARRRRMTRQALLWPLAAILVGSTAWAGATGRLGEVAKVVAHAAGFGAAATEPPVESTPVAQAPHIAPPAAAPSAAAEPEPAVPAVKRAIASPPATAPSAPPPTVSSEEQVLYRAAHRAHFEEHDWAGALRAWDAYLGAAPQGRFVPEAHYNRALCLVRLGRTGEARRALEPFAAGKFGTYRQREAKALLAAMGSDAAADSTTAAPR